MAKETLTRIRPESHRSAGETFPREMRLSDKVSIVFKPFDHDEKTFLKKRDEIYWSLKDVDKALFEYTPMELDAFGSNWYATKLTNYRDIKPFYGGLAEFAQELGKTILRFDPAWNVDFGLIRMMPAGTAFVGGGLSFAGDVLQSNGSPLALPLKFVGDSLAYTTFAGTGLNLLFELFNKPSIFPGEELFRRAIVAEMLVKYARQTDADPGRQKERIGIYYPKVHCAGIASMIENDASRKESMILAKPLKAIKRFRQSFFTGVEYIHDKNENKWIKKTAIEI